jgi:parallel beta-helix repeat protein
MKGKRNFLKRSILFVSAISLFLLPTSSLGATFCASNPTELQTALTTAESNGEDNTIKIVQGMYNGNFTYASTEAYGLTVEGGYNQDCASQTIDPANTILDGGGTDTVLVLVSQSAADFSVEGLTFQNGSSSSYGGGGLFTRTDGNVNLNKTNFKDNTGGGFYSSYNSNVSSTTTLTNNTITGNTGSGVAIAGEHKASSLTGNTFSNNTSTSGGGASLYGSSTLTNNTFTGNTASGFAGIGGGGLYVNGTATLTNNTFTGNTATNSSGGGAYIFGTTTTLLNNTFADNTADTGGGGLRVNSTSSTLINNIFNGNAAGSGGAASIDGTSSTLINNIFAGNRSTSGGGFRVNTHENVTIINNTITDNVAETGGGGAWINLIRSDYRGYLYNNIIWNNTASDGADLYIDNTGDDPFFPVIVNLFNNDFDQSASGTYIAEPFTIDPSNLDNEDPLFVGSGDYHLAVLSPCINSGDNDAPDLPTTDKDGNPRIMGGTVDMGAYEYQAVVYVNKDSDTCGGKTPCYTTIQEAIDASNDGALIKIVQGDYEENITLNSSKTLTLQGGYDSAFTTQSSNSTIKGSFVVSNGKLKTSKIRVLFENSRGGSSWTENLPLSCHFSFVSAS